MVAEIAVFLLKIQISFCGFGYLRIGSIHAKFSQIRQAIVGSSKGSVLSSVTEHLASSRVLLKPISIWVLFFNRSITGAESAISPLHFMTSWSLRGLSNSSVNV